MKACKDCKDCKHFREWNICEAPQLIHTFINPATGERRDEQTYSKCEKLRKDGLIMSYINGTCGARARWFEDKDEV